MASARHFANGNRLLQTLSTSDLDLLEGDFVAVDLKLRQQLETPNKKIEHVYFLDRGIASVVAPLPKGGEVEVGLIGCEGVTGLAVLHQNDRSPHSTYMQVAGSGRRIAADKLAAAMDQSASLRQSLLNYAHAFCVQTAHTAASGTKGNLPERLSRWLLMTHDRVEGNDLVLTHELLSIMLGVRRAGVTETLHNLSGRKLIKLARKDVKVLDRKGLEKLAGAFYGVPEREYRRSVTDRAVAA